MVRKLFPNYLTHKGKLKSGPLVSIRRINKAVPKVIEILHVIPNSLIDFR